MTHEQSGQAAQLVPPSEQLPEDEQQTLVNYYGLVHDAWERLLAEETEPLFGDEGARRRAQRRVTGHRRVFHSGGGKVNPARYDAHYRVKMAETIKDSGIELPANPIGHILLEKTSEGAAVSSTLYLLENNKVFAVTDCTIKNEEALSEDSEGCYAFISSFGLGDVWVAAMFSSQANETEQTSTTAFTFDDTSMIKLAEHLNSLAENPAN